MIFQRWTKSFAGTLDPWNLFMFIIFDIGTIDWDQLYKLRSHELSQKTDWKFYRFSLWRSSQRETKQPKTVLFTLKCILQALTALRSAHTRLVTSYWVNYCESGLHMNVGNLSQIFSPVCDPVQLRSLQLKPKKHSIFDLAPVCQPRMDVDPVVAKENENTNDVESSPPAKRRKDKPVDPIKQILGRAQTYLNQEFVYYYKVRGAYKRHLFVFFPKCPFIWFFRIRGALLTPSLVWM